MSTKAKRGRPRRQYQIRVRTERRDPIDYAKLAQAALEQAAMDQSRDDPHQSRSRVQDARQEPGQQDDVTEGDQP